MRNGAQQRGSARARGRRGTAPAPARLGERGRGGAGEEWGTAARQSTVRPS